MRDTEQNQRREVYYQGTVQGVGFRYTAMRIASRYSVKGYVQNLPDGRVFLVAEAPPGELDAFFGAVRNALGDFIDDTTERTLPAAGQFRHFDIRY